MAAQNGDESHEHLSLSLRPRGQQQTVTSEDPAESIVSGRKPFPLSEIEPHYSREPTQMKESAKQMEEKSELDAKNNNNNNGKNSSLSSTDDINDILSAFSIGGVNGETSMRQRTAKSRASQRRKLRSVVLVSPTTSNAKDKVPKFSNIEVTGEGQSPSSMSPRRFSVYKSKPHRVWNGGIGLGGNFPTHHLVHSHHHHHLHPFGDSQLVDLSPSTTKYNFVYGGRANQGNSPEKLDLDESVKMSPKVRFGAKFNSSSPAHQKYGKSPLTSSASLYQFSVTGSRRPVNQVF
jgi:hypothetical protein